MYFGDIKGKHVQFRWFVKILMLGLLGVAVSNVSFAEQLRCEQDFPKIIRKIMNVQDIGDHGSLNDLLRYYQQTQYAELFRKYHPNKYFFYNSWEDEKIFKEALEHNLNRYKQFRFAYELKYKFDKPDQNFILNQQELCIFNLTTQPRDDFHRSKTDSSIIAVRTLGGLDWRWVTIESTIQEQDFREFFPNFPKNIAIKELEYTH